MTIYFANPGDFDIRLLSTFGISSKPNSSNPIGKFGTGLKNAIAGVLRLGGEISITSGGTDWDVRTKDEDFRGTTHNMVYLVDTVSKVETPLSFSTALGSHWEPWMIYREFFANQRDENGPDMPFLTYSPLADVIFAITCPEVEDIYSSHTEYFLTSEPLETFSTLEIHPGPSNKVFYRGILVFTAEKPFLFTYNFKSGLTLTEDRTVKEYEILSQIVLQMSSSATEAQTEMVRAILEAKIDYKEYSFDYSYIWSATAAFKSILASSVRDGKSNASAASYGRKYFNEIGYPVTYMGREKEELLLRVHQKVFTLASSVITFQEAPRVFMSSEVCEPRNSVKHGDDIYLHPDAFKDERTLFKALLYGYENFYSDYGDFMFSIIEAQAFNLPAPVSSDEILF